MKLEGWLMKIVKKIHSHDFCLEKLVNFWRIQPDFWTAIQDLLKMTVLALSQHNYKKVKSFETSRWFPCQMAAYALTIGLVDHPRTL